MELLAFIGEIILEVFSNSKNRFIKIIVFLTSSLMVVLLLSLLVFISVHAYQNGNVFMFIISLLLTLGIFGFIIFLMKQTQRKREQTLHNIS
jgi:type IV secretory pathway TrbL component